MREGSGTLEKKKKKGRKEKPDKASRSRGTSKVGETEECWGRWSTADIGPIRVRGVRYLEDQKKVSPPGFHFNLIHVDIFSAPERLSHVAARPDSYTYKRPAELRDRLCFVVNWRVPGTPECNCVTYFQNKEKDEGFDLEKDIKSKKSEEGEEEPPGEEPPVEEETGAVATEVDGSSECEKVDHRAVFARTLSRFFRGSDAYRHRHFKFIPRIVEGNWLVQKAVGSTPAILGTTLSQSYHYDLKLNYFEVDVDVGSSSVAKSVFNLVKGYAKSLVIDMLFLIEGQCVEELPEQLLGGVRLSTVDCAKFQGIQDLSKTRKASKTAGE